MIKKQPLLAIIFLLALLTLSSWFLIKPAKIEAQSFGECGGDCYYDWDCVGPHDYCTVSNRCVCYSGYLCVDGTCEEAHKECVNYFCQYVVGSGKDTCSEDDNCRCSDTDGGKVTQTKGTTCLAGSNCQTDLCSSYVVIENNVEYRDLYEFFCESFDDIGVERYQCGREPGLYNTRCQDGACVQAAVSTPTPISPTPTPTPGPTATPTPTPVGPTPTSPPLNCDQLCQQQGYSSGTCRSQRSGCRANEVDIGRDNCSWRRRCCCEIAPSPTPTPTPTPSTKTISGTVFLDENKNGQKDGGEQCFQGQVDIWIDLDKYSFQSHSSCNQYSYQVSQGSHEVYLYPVPEGYVSTGWYGEDGCPTNCHGVSGSGTRAVVTDAEVHFGLGPGTGESGQSGKSGGSERSVSFFSRLSQFFSQKFSFLFQIFP